MTAAGKQRNRQIVFRRRQDLTWTPGQHHPIATLPDTVQETPPLGSSPGMLHIPMTADVLQPAIGMVTTVTGIMKHRSSRHDRSGGSDRQRDSERCAERHADRDTRHSRAHDDRSKDRARDKIRPVDDHAPVRSRDRHPSRHAPRDATSSKTDRNRSAEAEPSRDNSKRRRTSKVSDIDDVAKKGGKQISGSSTEKGENAFLPRLGKPSH